MYDPFEFDWLPLPIVAAGAEEFVTPIGIETGTAVFEGPERLGEDAGAAALARYPG